MSAPAPRLQKVMTQPIVCKHTHTPFFFPSSRDVLSSLGTLLLLLPLYTLVLNTTNYSFISRTLSSDIYKTYVHERVIKSEENIGDRRRMVEGEGGKGRASDGGVEGGM